ncbi:hypothetical protein [Actinomycetospora sp. TBRC 11914]|uniref:hypothetical protein n=1 Tax=Actinomycetospora sp. TBRC 11914 TaxID=2729387 RepID=UPI00145C9BBA|nr:hypothetical protein [Actinomycetospora sp. TBRC 11914]NMO92492.1 hypothetical protein [Actinomycetospora sp. TBRC 11914]
MVGHDAMAGTGAGGVRRPRVGGRVVAGLGVAAVLAIATALLVALLGGTASAQTGGDPGPRPYGGALEQVDPSNRVTSEEVLEVGMLGLGTLNGVAFAIAMIASRLRGPTTAQTRRALITRTGAGTVSESRRERRERERSRTATPDAEPAPVPPGPGAGGPRARVPRTPPEGAVPAQSGPLPREALAPAGRPPLGPPAPRGAEDARNAPHPPGPGRAPASPPAGVPLRPAIRR